MHKKCELCDLHLGCKRMVKGNGPVPAPVLFVAKAPGDWEDRSGIPFHPRGRAGGEFNNNCQKVRLPREKVRVTYLVKCMPKKNPKPEHIAACQHYLMQEIQECNPQIIATVGAVATHFFLGKVDMERVHGVPFEVYVDGVYRIILPIFDPAASLRDPNVMLRINSDFVSLGEVLRKQRSPRHPDDAFPDPDYVTLTTPEQVADYIQSRELIAIDTEETYGKTYCLSISCEPGTAVVIKAENKAALEYLADYVKNPDVVTVLHGSLYDIPELATIDIEAVNIVDTMVMAYLLQTEPQGLKDLAFRHCGMIMSKYKDMVGEAEREKAIEYLSIVAALDWPNPDPLIKWVPDEQGNIQPKVKQPQNIQKKAIRILKDIEKNSDTDPNTRWYKIKPEEGRGDVEDILGIMHPGYLSDIPWEDAEFYSARDADATIRVFPLLMQMIEAKGLLQTFLTDMSAIPMVVDMMKEGIAINPGYFPKLSAYFKDHMNRLECDIVQMSGGKPLNLSSHPQVSTLLFDTLRLPQVKGKSTDEKTLSRLVDKHPIIQKLRDWRSYHKLKTTYSDQIPKKVGIDGRVHTTFRITRTSTGRLSSANPNLMAVPVRSEESLRIREGFVAQKGCSLVSNDFSQIEMMIAAEVSQDKNMLQAFFDNADIHSRTASLMWGIPEDELDPILHRYPAKRIGFGILYGITAAGLFKQLEVAGAGNWTIQDCQNMIDMWFRAYPGVAKFMKDTSTHAKRFGFVRDLWGRIRYVPGVYAFDQWIRLEALRQAGNAPIQMGAQGVIKQAMGNLVPLYRELRKEGIFNPLIQTHDELMWEIQDELLSIAVPLIKLTMENAVKLSIPLKVDTKIGKSWGKMKEE